MKRLNVYVAVLALFTVGTLAGCSNTAASGPVAAGDYIEVRVSASNSSAHYIGQWRVRFRY